MKNFIELNSQLFLQKQQQQLILPQVKSKSLSISNSKTHISNLQRYHDKKSNQYLRKSQNKKSIVNLQEIQKKSIVQQKKINFALQRRKILSQYQTIDLWKQRYHPDQLIQSQKHKNKKSKQHLYQLQQQTQTQPSNYNFILDKKFLDDKITYKKSHKQSFSNLRLKKKNQKQKSIPDAVVIQRINQYKKLKKDQKLGTILRRQISQVQHIRKSYKSSLPIFAKPSPRYAHINRLQIQYNPSKWEIQQNYMENINDDQFL